MKNARITAVLSAAAWLGAPAAAPLPHDAWLEDFEQLKSALTANYPNLEWATKRGMDLVAHVRRARESLAAANDDAAARVALERFISGFGDGHLSLTWDSTATLPAADAAPRSTCSRLGFRSGADTTAIARNLPGYQALIPGDAYVGAGIVPVAGSAAGVLRIPQFAPDVSLCEVALRERALAADAPCEEACGEALERRTDDLFLEQIGAAIRAVAARRPQVLIVDVAGNGGGNDTAIAAARMIGGPDLPAPRMVFVRNEARARDLAEDAQALRAALRVARKKENARLREFIGLLEEARQQAAEPCDLAPLWHRQAVNCTNLVVGTQYAGGLLASELPASLRHKPWAEQVSTTARFEYGVAQWSGPVIILLDGGSASATELFAAMLIDGRRAIAVGAPTLGAGCGWTLPRQTTLLKNTGARVGMPDCARLRSNGDNELDGIQPQVLVGFRRYDSAAQRIQRLIPQLPAALELALEGFLQPPGSVVRPAPYR